MNTSCRVWEGRRTPAGYGRVSHCGKDEYVHRFVFEAHWGTPIPKGLCVLHECDNPACYNTDHLWLGTHADNMADRHAKGRSRNGKSGKILIDTE